MQAEEHVERLLRLAELVLVEIDGCDAAHQALLRRRLLHRGEAREERRRLSEVALRDADLAGEGEGAHVIGLEHRDVLERRQRPVGVALLAEHARALPVELADLALVLAHVEALLDDLEELVVLVPAAHGAEELVERERAPRIAVERARERDLGVVLRVGVLDEDGAGELPELGAALVDLAEGAELRARERLLHVIADALGRRPHALPRGEIAGAVLEHGAERLARLVRLACGEIVVAGERDRIELRVVAERRPEAVQSRGAAARIAAGQRELEVHQLGGAVGPGDERLRERGSIEQADERGRRLDGGLARALEVRRGRAARGDLGLAIADGERRAQPLDRDRQRGLDLGPSGGALDGAGLVLIEGAREAQPLGASDARRLAAALLERVERGVDLRAVLRGARPDDPRERRADREVVGPLFLDLLERGERVVGVAEGGLEAEPLERDGGRVGARLCCDVERAAATLVRVGVGAADRPAEERRAGAGGERPRAASSASTALARSPARNRTMAASRCSAAAASPSSAAAAVVDSVVAAATASPALRSSSERKTAMTSSCGAAACSSRRRARAASTSPPRRWRSAATSQSPRATARLALDFGELLDGLRRSRRRRAPVGRVLQAERERGEHATEPRRRGRLAVARGLGPGELRERVGRAGLVLAEQAAAPELVPEARLLARLGAGREEALRRLLVPSGVALQRREHARDARDDGVRDAAGRGLRERRLRRGDVVALGRPHVRGEQEDAALRVVALERVGRRLERARERAGLLSVAEQIEEERAPGTQPGSDSSALRSAPSAAPRSFDSAAASATRSHSDAAPALDAPRSSSARAMAAAAAASPAASRLTSRAREIALEFGRRAPARSSMLDTLAESPPRRFTSAARNHASAA